MKVHVLWYDYYEESYIVGIYTEEGKRKKIEEMKQEAIQYCKTWCVEYEKTLLKRKKNEQFISEKLIKRLKLVKVLPKIKHFDS